MTTATALTTAEAFCDELAARRWWKRAGDGVRVPVSLGIDEIHRRHLRGATIIATPAGQVLRFPDGSAAGETRRNRWEVIR